jgi:hypothetical protein
MIVSQCYVCCDIHCSRKLGTKPPWFFFGIVWNQCHDKSHLELASYLNEEDKMFEGSVEMCLLPQLYNFWEVLVVDVGINSKQPLQDSFSYREEIFRERNT